MNLFKLILFLLIFVLFGCKNQKTQQIPDDIIPKDTMVGIIADLHIAKARETFEKERGIDTNYSRKPYYNYVFEKHNVDSSLFDTSMYFYTQNIEMLNDIYEEVLISLSKKESEISAR